MTCLEVTLITALAYITTGFICYYFSESYPSFGCFTNEKEEKFMNICDILLWPLAVIGAIMSGTDEYY